MFCNRKQRGGGWAQEPRGYSPRWLWRHRAGQRARRPPGRWWTRWSGSESKSAGRQRSLGLTCWRRWCGNWRQYLQENFYIFGINNSNIQRMTTWAKYFNILKHFCTVKDKYGFLSIFHSSMCRFSSKFDESPKVTRLKAWAPRWRFVTHPRWRESPRRCHWRSCCEWGRRRRRWSRRCTARSRPRRKWRAGSASPSRPCMCYNAAGWIWTFWHLLPCTLEGQVGRQTHSGQDTKK